MTSIQPTTTADLDSALAALHAAKEDWVKISCEERVSLLAQLLEDTFAQADAWVEAGCKAKGVNRGEQAEGEEWIGAYMPVLRNIRLLKEALAKGAKPRLPKVSTTASGQHVAQIFPQDLKEKIMFAGFTAEIWIEKDKPPSQGQMYSNPTEKSNVALILSAGNQTSIGPMDCLYKLFVENQVCILKMNPVNAVVGPIIEKAFKALIDANWLRVVYGGADVGKYLCQHDQVDAIHITGSDKTHDAIVWGSPDVQVKNKSDGIRINQKPITSELGCVNPIIIVPGQWKEKELNFQARHVASMITHNAGFNCNSGDVVVLHADWPQKETFKSKVIEALNKIPTRKAYYPGALDRHEQLTRQYPDAISCGEAEGDRLAWTVLPNVPAKADEAALSQEAFCGILSMTEINASNVAEFLDTTVAFCNKSIWGTLSAHIFIDPRTEKSHRSEMEHAISNLEYGAIAINCWTGVNYGMGGPSWGAFPGHTLEQIESGIGVVHNTFLIDYPEKSVVRAPFVISPTPAWFADNKNTIALGRKLVAFERKPSWMKLIGVAMAALKG